MITLSPSLLAADFSALASEVEKVKNIARYLHFDIMDGHFVPNIAIGDCVLNSLRSHTSQIFDVHLMVEHPEQFFSSFIAAGADIITFHWETCPNAGDLIAKIHALGARAGISLKPATPIEAVFPFLDEIDLVLVMTVEPGFGGQTFLPECLEKIPPLKKAIEQSGRAIDLEVDGGIHSGNVAEFVRRGADVIVAGSAIFGAPDPAKAASTLLALANKACLK